MTDVALASGGASIAAATCADERFPPENTLDGGESTFWMTTGLFPQVRACAQGAKQAPRTQCA